MMAISALLTYNSPLAEDRFTFGKNMLFDGSNHKYATDAEEYILNKIIKSTEDAYLWNRLGNLYYKGGRADLAVSAFEYSLSIDPMQTESLFSLGMILSGIDPKEAANQYHKMLISAGKYSRMNGLNLRDLLSNGLRDLVYFHSISNGELSIIPPMHLYEELQIEFLSSEESSLELIEGEVDSDDHESFYPIAEVFMGKQRKDLPRKKVYFGKKKKKKRKK
jgi:tetratricopeptide (TPR) repeat protein